MKNKQAQLPKGWLTGNLEELCEMYQPKTISRKEMIDDGEFPVYGANGIIGRYDKYNHEEAELLITCRGATCGSVNISQPKSWINGNAMVIKPKKGIKREFLEYMFRGYVDLSKIITGAAQPQITRRSLNPVKISYPESLNEQQRIVSLLDHCFAAIDQAKANAEQNLQNAKEVFESYLQGVFEKRGEGWEEKFLDEVTDESCTLSYGIVQPGGDFKDGLPVVRPTDMSRKYIGYKGLKLIDPKFAEGYKRTKLEGNELLLCVRGTTGTVSITKEELKGGNVTRGIVPIRFNNLVSSNFGYFLLISPFVQNQIADKTYGAALRQINIRDVRKLKILIPPLTTQKSLETVLKRVSIKTQQLQSHYQKKIDDLEELNQSILQKAFARELKTEKMVEELEEAQL